MKKKKKLNAEDLPPPKGMEAWRIMGGLFFGLFGVYTLVALVSFLFTWAQDQSLLWHPDIFRPFVSMEHVENGGGKLGFLWSRFLVGKLFGLGAFIVPFFFLALSFFCLKLKRISLVRVFLLSVFGCIIISVVCSFIFGFTPLNDWCGTGAGGSYGYFVHRYLIDMLGVVGAGLLLFILFFVWLLCIFPVISSWLWRGMHPDSKPVPPVEPDMIVEEAEEQDLPEAVKMEIIAPVVQEVVPPLDDEPVFEVEENPNLSAEEEESDLGSLDTVYDPKLDLPDYQLPPLSLLEDYKDKIFEVPREELEKNNKRIVQTLSHYKISIEKIYARPGPTVTMYEIYPAPGVRIAQIKSLEVDIALGLAARGVRIIAPIPGTNAVGIEVANDRPGVVPMRAVLDSPQFKDAKFDLPIVIGKSISNEVMAFDLAKMPHLLVAGATGQGKSVGLNAIIASLLYRMHPSALKLVLVDPKKVELSLYSKLEKHFLAQLPDSEEPIITDTQKVVHTLRSLCIEMDARYDLLKMAQVRNLREYNDKFLSRKLNPHKGHRFLPFIVVIIDEFADLLMTAGREVEEPIARLAQLARAVGIHLVIATQRPDAKIITGLIKSNFPARIAFRVTSSVNSKIILDTTGAEQLIGRGDMLLYMGNELTRVQCALIDTPEVERIADFISRQKGYDVAHFLPEYTAEEDNGMIEVDLKKKDALFEEAAKLVVQYQQGSTSLIQRRMNLGYNRAGRIMDQLEAAGIVGPAEGSKARQVLISDFHSLDRILAAFGEK
ncbi:MAG: DNA translocase FtsK [Bacteroidales bacterium]|nr:DNA translocase FtsK [Bacteroidales bacterium]